MKCRAYIILSGLLPLTRGEKHYHNDFLDCWGWEQGELGKLGKLGKMREMWL
ncbi:hypothetical protein MC7420_1750 [Coleofasciculus chthonoplastes PCC 7420]|uniref:Uncharacterized protein n=1 Tax=Coleofasciculus chthonoplastes PCC 7420 TaxID=118168 RepID=B4VMQ8_9CYAN|nr:hypothetical protein MC7420_1750 [Coleofasciculus chthonoplastes PCC 7420]